MTTILEYLQAKYGEKSPAHILNKEAKVFGIPVPLRKGWLQKYGDNNVSDEMLGDLAQALSSRVKSGNKFAMKALGFMDGKIDVPISIFPVEKKKKRIKRKDIVGNKVLGVVHFLKHTTIDPNSSEFLMSFEWRSVRMMALKKYGAVCQCCGASPKTGAVINVDHIKPRKIYPHLALSLDNLQVLCNACNHGKGNWDSTDWR